MTADWTRVDGSLYCREHHVIFDDDLELHDESGYRICPEQDGIATCWVEPLFVPRDPQRLPSLPATAVISRHLATVASLITNP